MRDFDQWFNEQGLPPPEAEGAGIEPDFPEGLYVEQDGLMYADCCNCGAYTEYCGTVEEFDPAMHYCGRSPRCCP